MTSVPDTARSANLRNNPWGYFRAILMEDTSGANDEQFDDLGVTDLDTLSLVEELDILECGFSKVIARALIITGRFWAKKSAEEKAAFLRLGNKHDWLLFCRDWKTKEEEEKQREEDTKRAIENYEKGVKRDISAFPVLKSNGQWRPWLEGMRTAAEAQRVSPVFDPDYNPSNDKEEELFKLMQTYGYSVLKSKVQTLAGKTIVRKFEKTHDCQGAIRELISSQEEGLTGTMSLSDAEDKVKELRLENRDNRSIEGFFSRFEELIMDVDALREENDKVTDDEKERWLRDALRPHTIMSDAVNQYDLQQNALVQNGLTVQKTYANLIAYLITCAKQHDKEAEKKKKGTRIIRNLRQGEKSKQQQYQKEKRTLWNQQRVPYKEWSSWSEEKKTQHRNKFAKTLADLQKKYNINMSKTSKNSDTTPQNDSKSINAADAVIVSKDAFFEVMAMMANSGAGMVQRAVNNTNSSPTIIAQQNSSTVEASNQGQSTLTAAQEAAKSTDAGRFIQLMLSKQGSQPATSVSAQPSVQQVKSVRFADGKLVYDVSNINYRITLEQMKDHQGSLIDGGANGGMFGDDGVIISKHLSRKIDLKGIADGEAKNLDEVHFASLIETHKGPVIGHFYHYANYGKGQTILCKGQMTHFGIHVDDVSRNSGGTQRIVTPDGYVIPISIRGGLPHMDMRKPTQEELDNPSIPHVDFNADLDKWEPSVLDNEYSVEDIAPEADSILEEHGVELA